MDKFPNGLSAPKNEIPAEPAGVRTLEAGRCEVEEGERIFTAEEVYSAIEAIEGVNRGDFTSIVHTFNSEGILVSIDLMLKKEVALKKFKWATGYDFHLKTRASTSSARSVTAISRLDYNDAGECDYSKGIADYVDGSWR